MSKKTPSMLKNGAISLIATFLIKGLNFISIPIFSRIMTTEEYGDANLFITYVSIFTVLVGLDFYAAVAKGQLEFKDKKDSFMSVGVVSTFIVMLIFLCVFNCFAPFFGRLLSMDRFQLNMLIIYSYAMVVVQFLSSEYIFNFKYKENMLLSTNVAVLNIVVSVILVVTVFKADTVNGRIIGAALPTIIIAGFVFVYIVGRGKVFFDRAILKFYAGQGIPLIPHNLSHFILGNSDKIMIKNMIGAAENGIYTLIYSIGLILAALIEALNNVFTPWMFRKLEAGKEDELTKSYSIYALLFSCVTLIIAACTPEVVKIFAPKAYWDGIKYILWIVFSTYLIFIYQLYVNIEFYDMKTYLISTGTVFAAAINVVLNILFLKHFGYGFAAISTVVAYGSLVLFHMFIVNVILKRRIINNKHVAAIVLGVLGLTLIFQACLRLWLIRYAIAVAVVFFTALYCLKSYKNGGFINQLIKDKSS